MNENKHTWFFGCLCLALVIIGAFPGFFDWSNRIDPWVMGVPFVMFWMLLVNFLICVALAGWYIADSVKGDLDIDIEPLDEKGGV